MNSRKRQGRGLFLAFVCAAWFAVFLAAPLASSLQSSSTLSASAGASRLAKARGAAGPAQAKQPRAVPRRDLPTDK
jgi:hypothetical protein